MKDPNFTAYEAIDRSKPPLVCYQASPVRKDWDHPSPGEVAESLKHAHSVNRRLVKTVNELYDRKDTTEVEMEQLRSELRTSRLKNTILASVLSSAVTSGILAGILALARAFTR